MLTVLLFYGCFVIIILSASLIGFGVFALLNVIKQMPNFFCALLFSLLMGSVVIVLLTSMVCTHFKTISLVFIPLLGVLFFEYGKGNLQKKDRVKFMLNIKRRDLIWLFTGNLIIFLSGIFLFYHGAGNYFTIPTKDIPYYGDLSYYLLHTGQENYFHVLNLYSTDYNGVVPYHYFELWFNAFWANLLHLNFSQCFYFLICPFFTFCYFTGLLACVSLICKGKNVYYLFALWSLFIGGICFTFYNSLPFLHYIRLDGYILYPMFFAEVKVSLISSFFIAVIILFYEKHNFIGFVILLFLPVCSIALMPSIIGGIILLYFAGRFFKLDFIKDYRILLLSIVVGVCILFFYFLMPQPETGKTVVSFYGAIHNSFVLTSFAGLKNALSFLFAYSLLAALLYFPFWMVNSNILRQNGIGRNIFLLWIVITICGLLLSAINFVIINNFQLFTLSSFSLANVLVFLISLQQLHEGKSLLRKTILLTFFFIAFIVASNQEIKLYKVYPPQTPAFSYLNKIKTSLVKNNLSRGISIKAPKEYKQPDNFSINTYVNGEYIPFYLKDGLIPISGSELSAVVDTNGYIYDKTRDLEQLQTGIFFRFVQEQKRANLFRSVDASLLDFIDKYKIDFAVISPNTVIPNLLQNRISISFHDSVTGDNFLVFRKVK
jgi:hypothetical protein